MARGLSTSTRPAHGPSALSPRPLPRLPLLSVELDEPTGFPQSIEDILCDSGPGALGRQTVRDDFPFLANTFSGRIEVSDFLAHAHFEDMILCISLEFGSGNVRFRLERDNDREQGEVVRFAKLRFDIEQVGMGCRIE